MLSKSVLNFNICLMFGEFSFFKIKESIIMFSPLEQFDIIFYFFWKFPIPFLNLLWPIIVIYSIFLFIIIYFYNNISLIPTVIQLFFENLFLFIINLIKQQIGSVGYIFIPFIFTVFNFILFMNLLSLIPFGLALTSHIIMIFWLSITICLAIFILGLYKHHLYFLYIFIPQAPILLLPMLIVIEIFSQIIRAFSLAIRLSANIMAGHTLVHIIASFLLLISIKIFLIFIGISFLFTILLLEVGVAFLQAYVFSVLICIYIHDALLGGH
jgi:ATP synthase subunit 6